MKNNNLILILLDKSLNAFGQLIGLTEEAKLKTARVIISETIKEAFDINSNELTKKELADFLEKKQLDYDHIHLLTNLLLTQAEISSKLKQPIASLTNYENTLQLLQWQPQQTNYKMELEKQNKINGLKMVISTLQRECTKSHCHCEARSNLNVMRIKRDCFGRKALAMNEELAPSLRRSKKTFPKFQTLEKLRGR